MKTTRYALIAATAIASLTLPLAAAETSTCVTQNANARIAWTAPAGESVRSVRAYFRSDAASAEHYVELRRAGNNGWTAVLPRTSSAAQAIEYRIATAAAGAQFITRSEGRITVGETCKVAALDSSDQQLAKALIIGATQEGPAVPAGFRCEGIIGLITAKGALQSYAACSELAKASAATGEQPQVADASTTAAKDAATQKTATARSASAPRVATTEGVVAQATRDPRNSQGNPNDNPRRPPVSARRP
jgi:hypothetical protein